MGIEQLNLQFQLQTSSMKLLTAIVVAMALFAVYTECAPTSEDDMPRAYYKLQNKVMKATLDARQIMMQRMEAYFAKDNLGDKLADVVAILMGRLTKHVDQLAEKFPST